MNKSFYSLLDSAASLHIPDDLDLFPSVKAQLTRRRTFMQTLRARPALAAVLVVLALILLTGVAYAIGRSLGYIPGIGLVEQGTQLRVLAEPVSQTREDVTVTIVQVVVDPGRTVVVYKAEGLSLAAANSKGEGASGHYPNLLRLPDGTAWEELPSTGYSGTPEPLLDTVRTKDGWPSYVRRLVYPPVDPQVTELTLLLPGLENMPAGTAPENWEITFHLKPAPADITVVPITTFAPQTEPATTSLSATEATGTEALSNVSTLNGITLSLDNVIEVQDGFVFTGKLTWDAAPFPANSIVSIPVQDILGLTDGTGQQVPIEEVPLSGTYDYEHERPWSFRTNRKDFNGPLVFHILALQGMYTPPPFEFDLDLGTNPQIGQTWVLNREFAAGGQAVRVSSTQLIDNAGEACLVFEIDPVELAFLKDLDTAPSSVGCTGRGGRQSASSPFYAEVGYPNIPSGIHHFSLQATVGFVLPGKWHVAWDPPASSEPTATAQIGPCLDRDRWAALIDRNDPLPAGVGGKVVTTVNEGGNLPMIYVTALDGSSSQKIEEAAWPSLSKDGTHLIDSAAEGLHVIDLAARQYFPLKTDGYRIIWSPDNTRIMYTNTFHLFVANVDGSGVQTIDTGSAQVIAPAGWLADNQTILYSAMGGEGFNLKSYNLQSGETKDLFIIHNKAGYASVSPDGQWIVFADLEFGAQAWTIFISRTDGTDQRRVTSSDLPLSFISVWGPDSQWLILNTTTPDQREVPVLVNPFTCQAQHLNTISGVVEDWGP